VWGVGVGCFFGGREGGKGRLIVVFFFFFLFFLLFSVGGSSLTHVLHISFHREILYVCVKEKN